MSKASENSAAVPDVYAEFIAAGQKLASPPSGEELVISGISGHFPRSVGLYQLHDNLLNLPDLMTEDESGFHGSSNVPHRLGKITCPEKFDASFFGVDANTAFYADPQVRLLMETTYEAIVDAGVHPDTLRNKRVGVVTCAVLSETEVVVCKYEHVGKGLMYCNRPLQAGLIAYWLGVTGPALLVDTACSSSMFALDAAYQLIRTGECDAAIVSGGHLCLHKFTTAQFANLGVLSVDGYCRSFDEDGNGFVRSETVGSMFIQKAKDARRMYAKIIHTQTNCDGYKKEGITFPSYYMQEMLLRRFYKESGVDLQSVKYIEAHATGTKVGDPEEVRAIDNVFFSERKGNSPILIGSVKSKFGHAEPLSGLASIARVILCMETGLITANGNFRKPRSGVPSLEEGRLKVVAEHTPFPGGPVPINCFGFGGCNAHVALAPNPKVKVNNGAPKDGLPRLVTVSGRTPEAVHAILSKVESMKLVDAEFVSLLHELHVANIHGHLYRGYTIVPSVSENSDRIVQLSPLEKKYAVHMLLTLEENKCNAATIGPLMQFEIFSATMYKCFQALKLQGVDLTFAAFLTDEYVLELQNSITTSVQISLLNLLKVVGVKIDVFIGSCPAKTYAEGGYTLEEALHAAYELDTKRHCARYGLADGFTSTEPGTATADYGSAVNIDVIKRNYQNFICQTEEIIILEISPVSRLSNSLNILTNIRNLLHILGRLYLSQMNLHLTHLYPKVQYPVSRGTSMLAPFIIWEHSEDWFVTSGNTSEMSGEHDFTVDMKMLQKKNQYLFGHNIDGRILYPATGYIMMVLEGFCIRRRLEISQLTVLFEDIRFLRATNVPKSGMLVFQVINSSESHEFEIIEGGSVIVTGRFQLCDAPMLSDGLELPRPAPGVTMDKKDIYKELKLRGYNYNGIFQSLVSLDPSASVGRIIWKDNSVAYMDNMLQVSIFQLDTRNLYVPVRIKRIVADFSRHKKCTTSCDENEDLPIYCWKDLKLVRSGGIEIYGLYASPIPKRRVTAVPVIENYGFVPYQGHSTLSFKELLRVSVHVALENNPMVKKVKTVELPGDKCTELLSTEVANILADLPVIQASLTVLGESPSSNAPEGIKFEKHGLNEESGCLLVLGTGLIFGGSTPHLKHALAALAENGLIISKETVNGDLRDLEQSVTVVMNYTVAGGNEHLIVVKKKCNPKTDVKFVNVSENDCTWLPKVQSLTQMGQHQVVLIAQGNNNSGIIGLTNCTRLEPGGRRIRCFFIKDHEAPAFDPTLEFYQNQLALNLAVNVYEKGCWGSYRHLPLKSQKTLKTSHAFNTVRTFGDLSTLVWQQGYLNPTRDVHSDGFAFVYYSALNFRDIMAATGRLAVDVVSPDRRTQDCVMGYEFSGRDKIGRRVMGIIPSGSMSTMVLTSPLMVWTVPDNWSLAEAATVPIVYLTILMAFRKAGGVRKGDSVLIHAGSGGVGQAAINYCLFHGCNVFTTVGTPEKKKFILQNYPQVPESHIGNSRDTSFEQMIMRETNGRGVDMVLNSLAEEKLQASVRCLAKGGRFLEIGKFDVANDNKLAMEILSRNITFISVMLDVFFHKEGMTDDLKSLGEDFQNALNEGSVKPLIKTIFKVDEIEQAYRYMAAAKHIGKVLVAVREEEKEKLLIPSIPEIDAEPRFYCKPDLTYIIVGGLGGFGLELADWLILRRAQKLILVSRRGISNGYQETRIRLWTSYSVKVIVSTDDVTTQEGCSNLLVEANKLGPVGGIFNLAVNLQDAVLENQTMESFQKSAGPKAVATSLLDINSQKMCPQLHSFVVFSSVSCGRGNAGQSNYGWSNSVMERICEERHSRGLPALAIQWGAVGDVGLVAQMQQGDKEFVVGGTLPQKITSCLSLLDTFLLQSSPIVSSMVVAEKQGGLSQSSNLLEFVSNVLGIKDLKTVNQNAPLSELGMDSMMAVEIKQAVEMAFEVFLTAEEVRNLTLSAIVEMMNKSESEAQVAVPEGTVAESSDLKTETALLKLEGMKACKIINQQCLPGSHNVYVLPGIEGDADTMPILSSKINAASVKCLQPGFYAANEYRSISELAHYFLPYILDDLTRVPTFTLVGFSFGGLVALELTALLESRGHTGSLVLIDSTPDYVKTSIQRMGKDYSLRWLADFVTKMGCGPDAALKLQAEGAGLEWSEKVEIVMRLFPSVEIQNSQDARSYLSTIDNRLTELACASGPYKTIQSPVTLIKSTGSYVPGIGEAYGLEKICQNIAGVHTVTGTHFSIIEEAETANIINNMLQKSNKY